MSNEVILTCAVSGSQNNQGKHPSNENMDVQG